MSGVMVNQTIDVLSKALKNFASEDKTKLVRPSEVILIIGISDIAVEEPTVQNPIKRVIGEPFYRVIKQNEPYMRSRKIKAHPGQAMTDEVSFLQVLNSKIDFFQIEVLAKPVLMEAFTRLTDELNEALLNDEGFKSYVEASLKPFVHAGHTPEMLKAEEAAIVAENSYKISDLEIWVLTPKRDTRTGVAPNDQDLPIAPVPVLYAKGEMVRQLSFDKDIFQILE